MWYALIVVLASLLGAALPLRFQLTHARLQLYLSLAAGALLGAAVFHLLPEAAELVPEHFGITMAAGIVLVFLMQRYVAPHSHELMAPAAADHQHGHHHHACTDTHQQHGTGPFLTGMITILALSVHSFLDGVAIGVATSSSEGMQRSLELSVFLSVLIHKPMDGMSVSILLIHSAARRSMLWLIQVVYALLVPLGAAAFWLMKGELSKTLETPLVGHALAFSAGIFCSIALTDLLPELHFHKHDRNKLSAALLLGLGVMLLTRLIENP